MNFSTAGYWEHRYSVGRNQGSGPGSHGVLGMFKCHVVNSLIEEHQIRRVLDFGCGDGAQIGCLKAPFYIGVDVSPSAIAKCRQRFAGDGSRVFYTPQDYVGEVAALVISLDVIYHLVEDAVYESYMHLLFEGSTRFVLIYSTDTDENPEGTPTHIRHHKFSSWVTEHRPDFVLKKVTENPFPYQGDLARGSWSSFYLYERT